MIMVDIAVNEKGESRDVIFVDHVRRWVFNEDGGSVLHFTNGDAQELNREETERMKRNIAIIFAPPQVLAPGAPIPGIPNLKVT